MSLRLWTYLTLNAAGDPIVGGASFDITQYSEAADMSLNTQVQRLRDGTEILVDDPQFQLPTRLDLSIASNHVDLLSRAAYLGNFRYLGPVLYYHKSAKLPICLFFESSQVTARKAYLCRFLGFDRTLAAISNINTINPIYYQGAEPLPASMDFELYVDRDGVYTDVDDITTSVFSAREPAS